VKARRIRGRTLRQAQIANFPDFDEVLARSAENRRE
jgi:hypothetical protein